ncbi:serine/threonine-protein kinase [Amycolatopsis sp. NPDC059657]|uniref:serine/threonine-protein kinase n=1 Tax=Amycolatopsis sp. NPDC059657 TaxID=3346899 RepID=UPI00366D67E4
MSTEGSVVGERYRLDQPIGRGRAGIVWLALDLRLHRTVAMKRLLIPSGLTPEQAAQAREQAFLEGRNAAKIEHKCAITVHDVFHENDDVWIVMEYIPSRSMAQFLAEHGRLTPEQAAGLGIQLGSTLATLHAANIIHRTLEPGTVLLADDGGVKLTDIGITGGGPTPAYRAPEVARGLPATPASDVFSLGATLYTAVEGVPPYGENGQGGPPAIDNAGPLSGALGKMLRQDPITRPTMNDTVRSLNAISHGDTKTAFVPPTAPAMPIMPATPPSAAAPGTAAPTAIQQPVPPHQAFQPRPAAPPRPPKPASAKPKWLIPAVAVVVAILVGVLIAELFFV